jgi:hypothetical protein
MTTESTRAGVTAEDARPIVVVGCGFPQLGLLRAFRARGIVTVGLDQSATAVGVPLASSFLPVSTAEVAAVASAVVSAGARGIAT